MAEIVRIRVINDVQKPPLWIYHHMRRSSISISRPALLTWIVGKSEVICEWRNRQTILSKIIKSAIHVARLTIRVMDVRNIFYFSDRLIEDRRWQIR